MRLEEECTGIRNTKEELDQAVIGRRMYRNPVREEKTGSSSDQKKNVPESGTRRKVRSSSDQKKNVPKSDTQRKSRSKL